MSSASSYRYRVVETEAQREARLRQGLEESERQLKEEWTRLVQLSEDARERYGERVTIPEVPAAGELRATDNDEFERRLQAARASLAGATERLDIEVQGARTEKIVAGISRTSAAESSSTKTAAEALSRQRSEREGATPPASGTQSEREELIQDVARVVGRLNSGAGPEITSRVELLAERALNAEADSGARSVVDRLRHEVQEANETARSQARAHHELSLFRRQLSASPGPGTAGLLKKIAEVEATGGLVSEQLRAEVERTCAEARRETEREQVAKALRDSMQALGYEVGPGFETLLVERGYADARRPDWRGYAVRVRAPEDSGEVNLNLVKGASAAQDEIRDVEVERSFCDQLPQVTAEVSNRGVELDLTRQVSPGEVPMLAVRDLGDEGSPAPPAKPTGKSRDAG